MSQRLPDLEVYILCPDIAVIQEWLARQFPSLVLLKEKKGKPASFSYQAEYKHHTLPIVLVEKAIGKFASLWIDSSHSPWDDDEMLAKDIVTNLQLEVRFAKNSWTEEQDTETNDNWIKLTTEERREILWRT
ncbi:hypothetical protein [Gynuella sp.]|uniref:hypothetical protein n=1 Tax=Gynuella sp. TaxID=2969146 RepID=UPI003D13755D